MLRVRRGKLPLLAAAVGATLPSLGFAQNGVWNYAGGTFLTWTQSWNNAAYWTPNTSYPNGSTQVATFTAASIAGGNGTVTLNTGISITVAQVNFFNTGTLNGDGTSTNSYSLGGAGSLIIANNGTINVARADSLAPSVTTIYNKVVTPSGTNLYKVGEGTLILSGTNAFGGGISVNEGALIATSANSLAGATMIATVGNGIFGLNNCNTSGSLTFGGLGSTGNPVGGMIQSIAGNNTWNGSWFIVAPASAGVVDGTLTVSGAVIDNQSVGSNGFSKYGAGTLKVSSLPLYGPLVSDAGALVSAGSVAASAVTVNSGNLIAGRVLTPGALTIGSGATVAITTNGTNAATSKIGQLSIAGGATPTGAFDLNNNTLVIDYTGASPIADVAAQLLSGRGGVGLGAETWAGQGIKSTHWGLGGDPSFAIGYADNAALPLGAYADFGGVTVDDTSILLKYTWSGDATLNGLVDDDDVTIVGAFYGGPGDWSLGDFTYNGLVDDDDVTLLGALYNPGGTPLSPATLTSLYGADFAAAFARGQAMGVSGLVPEPGSLGLIGVAGLLLARRRSRR